MPTDAGEAGGAAAVGEGRRAAGEAARGAGAGRQDALVRAHSLHRCALHHCKPTPQTATCLIGARLREREDGRGCAAVSIKLMHQLLGFSARSAVLAAGCCVPQPPHPPFLVHLVRGCFVSMACILTAAWPARLVRSHCKIRHCHSSQVPGVCCEDAILRVHPPWILCIPHRSLCLHACVVCQLVLVCNDAIIQMAEAKIARLAKQHVPK